MVRKAGDERRFGSDDDEIDSKLARERDERRRVVGPCGMTRGQGGYSRIAGGGVQLAEPAAARKRPRERVLAAARSHDQHLHPSDPRML